MCPCIQHQAAHIAGVTETQTQTETQTETIGATTIETTEIKNQMMPTYGVDSNIHKEDSKDFKG